MLLNLFPPPGFLGMQPHVEVEMYFRRLPHWRQPGATYFFTFRLADSLPQEKLAELKDFRDDWLRKNPPPQSQEALSNFSLENMRRIERWLDQGMGSCVLKDKRVAQIVADSLLHFDGVRYELASYVVMPNHVHGIVRPMGPAEIALEDILRGWKGYISRLINEMLQRKGILWQEESFDRIVRDVEHLYRAIQYIGMNPAKAGIARESWNRWVRPEWTALGWNFEDELGK